MYICPDFVNACIVNVHKSWPPIKYLVNHMAKILVATCLNTCEGKSTHGTNIKELEKYIYIYIKRQETLILNLSC